MTEPTSVPEDRYWLILADAPAGPFEGAAVRAKLAAGEVHGRTLVCPVGRTDWRPLIEVPAFGPPPVTPEAAFSPPSPPPLPPIPPMVPTGGANLAEPAETPLTNPRLPLTANLVCVYGLLIAPLLWIVDHLTCCVTGPNYRAGSGYDGAELVLIVVGGGLELGLLGWVGYGAWQLRRLHPSGPLHLKWAFAGWLITQTGLFLIQGLVSLAASAEPESPYTEPTPAFLVVMLLTIPVAFAEVVFVVVAWIWLIWNTRRLPLLGPAASVDMRAAVRKAAGGLFTAALAAAMLYGKWQKDWQNRDATRSGPPPLRPLGGRDRRGGREA